MNILTIATEIILKIFNSLPSDDLLYTIPVVCKRFYNIVSDDSLWKRKSQEEYPTYKPESLMGAKNWRVFYLRRLLRIIPKIKKNTKQLTVDSKYKYPTKNFRGLTTIKSVIVGDKKVGKTCVAISYTTEAFPGEYIPALIEPCSANVMVNGLPINLSIWDTDGRAESDKIRPLAYPETNVFLFCFSLSNPKSLWAIHDKFVPEINELNPGVPYILVGLKEDLLEFGDDNKKIRKSLYVSYEEGYGMAKAIGAKTYLECSAYTQRGLKAVFDGAIEIALNAEPTKKKKKIKDKCATQ